MGDFSVRISHQLVDRIIGKADDVKKQPKKIKQKLQKKPHEAPAEADQKQVSGDGSELLKGPPTGFPARQPIAAPPASSLTAELDVIRSILKESERVVEKLHKLEENFAMEVTQRAKDLQGGEFKLPSQKPMPCSAENSACLDCYKEHTKDSFKCAYLVRNFANCARRATELVGSKDK